MRMRESTRASALMGALIFFSVIFSSDAKEVYQWVDEKGTLHFAEDESAVPEKYREGAERKSIPEEAEATKEKGKVEKQDGKKTKDRSSAAEKERMNKNKIEGDVMDSARTILSLWKDEKYGLLFDHGDQKSRSAVSKEEFEHRMKKKGIVLASSWEAVRDIQVDVKGPKLAYATVKIGFKSLKGGETTFRTETYKMSLEKGMWRIDLGKLLSTKIHK